MEYYICTDITEEKSPCECQAPVHMTCLHQWIKKIDNNRLVCDIYFYVQGVTDPVVVTAFLQRLR